MEEINALGIEAFGDLEKFQKWLDSPNFFFDKKKPKEWLDTEERRLFLRAQITGLLYGDNV
jgi:uncharacterized protein (DUF2384 family)